MNRNDILSAELLPEGVRLVAADGRAAIARFDDFERLRTASEKQRAAFALGRGGLRWDGIDEDLSYDGIFEPAESVLHGSALLKPLNMSELARRLGIRQSLMAAYVNGSKRPSAARERRIREELRKIGKELLDAV